MKTFGGRVLWCQQERKKRMKYLGTVILVCIFLILPITALSATFEVSIDDAGFKPSALTINKGDTVRWTNVGTSLHSATSGTNGVINGVFNSGLLNPGVSFEQTFASQGDVDYFDLSSPRTGKIIILGNGIVISPRDSLLLTSQGFDLVIYVTMNDPNNPTLTGAKIELIFDGTMIFNDDYSSFKALSPLPTILTVGGSFATTIPVRPNTLSYGIHTLIVKIITQSGIVFSDKVVYSVTEQANFLP